MTENSPETIYFPIVLHPGFRHVHSPIDFWQSIPPTIYSIGDYNVTLLDLGETISRQVGGIDMAMGLSLTYHG